MALDDELAALERQMLSGPTGDWLKWLDKLKGMSAMGSPGIYAEVMSQWEPDLYPALSSTFLEAYEVGSAGAVDDLAVAAENLADLSEEAMTQAQVAADALPPKSLGLIKHAKAINDDAAAALEMARKLLNGGADTQTALAPLFKHANGARYGIVTSITDSGNAGVQAVGEAVGLPMVWVAERNSCVRCLAHQGHVVSVGGTFPAGMTFGSHILDDSVSRPPLHGHCRCHLEVLHSPSYAEALRREAQRSVLRGYSLESEPMSERVYAANKLVNDPELVAPASVKKAARAAVKRGYFESRDPYAAPPDPPRPAAQSATPKPKPTKPKPAPKAAKPAPKKAPPKAKTYAEKFDEAMAGPPPIQPKVRKPSTVETIELPDRTAARKPMSEAEVKSYAAMHLKPVNRLPQAERSSIDDYTGPGYGVNATLRRGGELTEDRADLVKNLDKAISRHELPHDLVTTRMLKPGVFQGLVEHPGQYNTLVGQVLKDPGYTSTAVGGFPAGGWDSMPIRMNLLVPKGTNASYIAPISMLPQERELLLGRDTEILIESVEKVGDKWHVNATVLPKPKPPQK